MVVGSTRTSLHSVTETDAALYDVIVIGAGIAGVYSAYKLQQTELTFCVLEAGSEIGGTWHWNRYPGARCDTDSLDYSFSFSDDLQQEWTWSERYAGQEEILEYINHVVDRFHLRPKFRLNKTVKNAVYEEDAKRWRLETDREVLFARYVIMATGLLSTPLEPDIPGLENFQGELYHTSRWPAESVSFAGKRVGVIGTGSSGIQVIPIVAKQAASLAVFQRTASYTVPARNGPVDPEYLADYRRRYPQIREDQRNSWLGSYWSTYEVNEKAGKDATQEEREAEFEWRWRRGGQGFMVCFSDIMSDMTVNRSCADFVRGKIAETVTDAEKLRKLLPSEDMAIACKRLVIDTDYYATFNRENVTLVSLQEEPIKMVETGGVRTGSKLYELDMLVLATGFDAFTGAVSKMAIIGVGGADLKEVWRDGPTNYLGVLSSGFPNMLFVNGPLSAPGNFMTTTEMLVDRIIDLISFAERTGVSAIDTTSEAEGEWAAEVNATAESLPALFQCNSTYLLGTNIPGKTKAFLTYFGGLPRYYGRWNEIEQQDYKGFEFS